MSQLLAVSFSQVFGVQFWINVGLLAAIYGLFTAGMQLNIGTTGLYNFAQAGFINSSAASTAFDELVQSIKSAQIVVLEIVERTVIGGQAPLLDSSVQAKLAASLGEG